jgi:peptidyl-prolyl cis-trans isomerase B (cyclophilin B)
VAVDSRTESLGAGAPAGVLFAMPSVWALLQPAGGAWSTGATVDAARIAEEDRRDGERIKAWYAYDTGQRKLPPGPPEAVRAHVEKEMLAPLARIAEIQPDLAAWTQWIRGTVLMGFGEAEAAETAYRAALAAMPGMREAAYQLHVKLRGPAFAEAQPDQPTDYERALARIELERVRTERDVTTPDRAYALEGLEAARGLLLYRKGDFLAASEALAPLAKRYPQDALLRMTREHALAYLDAWAQEALLRKAEDARGDLPLPRVRLVTTKGPVTVDLYEDDAPNTVKNFVWLAEHRFYDGTAFHRNVPYFVVQGGDPFTKVGADTRWVGAGGPGYAIATEPLTSSRGSSAADEPGKPRQEGSRRRAFRGTLVMSATNRDTEGSQFFVTTGSAAHLDGSVSVFGRIVEGQAAADALVEGDKLLSVEIVKKRPGTEYRPLTLGRKPAPEPMATGPKR